MSETVLGVLLGAVASFAAMAFALSFIVQKIRRDMERFAPLPATAPEDPGPPTAPAVRAPLQQCKTCAHFDVEAGQVAMRENPAFVMAMQSVPPWRMGRMLATEPNPEHVLLVTEIDAARAAGDDEKVRSLSARLDTTPPTRPLPDDQQDVDKHLLKVRWDEFGACMQHSEVRAPIDTCTHWWPGKVQS